MSVTVLGVVLFLIVYAVITTDLINKTIAALMGASLFLLLHVLPAEVAFRAVDWNVVVLLISMMVIVGITKHTGLFQFIAIKAAKIARGEPTVILILLSIITAVFSAFLDNVTTVLIIVPVTMLIAVELGVSPLPFIISVAIASNMGGTATLIGDPPNIMIGSAAGLDFMAFAANLAPVVVLQLGVTCVLLYFMFRKRLSVTMERKARIMDFDESKALDNLPLLAKSLFVLGLTVAGFLLHGVLEVEASVVALTGASLLMILAGGREVDRFLHEVEWGTILFFVGLFILVGGLVEIGVIDGLSKWFLGLTGGDLRNTAVILVWGSGLLSAFVDNIPYVATMIPLIKDIGAGLSQAAVEPLWWSLALGACLGGNGTLVGASANVVAAGLSSKSGHDVSFIKFTKYGAPITLINLGITTAYVLFRYY